MASLIKAALEYYHYMMEDCSDPRVKNYYLMSSPIPILAIVIAYLTFVHKLGPRLMAHREPFGLDWIMIVYNMLQVALNSWFFTESMIRIWIPMRYSIICEEVNYSQTDVIAVRVTYIAWCFFASKILDLLDTVFMILRKKDKQVSFLHLYHHTAMVVAMWIGVKYVAGGQGLFFGTVNSFVHTVMYSYYLLTTLYPEAKKSLWWKKHITELQLAQFVITAFHGFITLIQPNCNYPKLLLAAFIPQDVFMFFLFWDFYRKTYLKPLTQPINEKTNEQKKQY